MKKLLLIPIIILLSISCGKEQITTYKNDADNEEKQILTKGYAADSVYYWASGKKVYLSVVPDKYFVVFDKNIQSEMKSLVSITSGKEISSRSVCSADEKKTYFMTEADTDIINAYSSDIIYSAPYLLLHIFQMAYMR